MAKNKIIYGNETLIDLTGDTVSSDNLLSGATAHDRSGEQIQGSVVIPTVNDGILTIKQNNTSKGTFTANQAGNTTVELTDEKVKVVETNTTGGNWNYPMWRPNMDSTGNAQVNDGFRYYQKLHDNNAAYGRSILQLGNAYSKDSTDADEKAGNKRGELRIYSEKSGYITLYAPPDSTGGKNIYFPDAAGTLALTDDITDVNVKQTATSNTENVYPVLLSNSTSSSTNTTSARKSKIFFKPGANNGSAEFSFQDSLGNECYINTLGYLKLGVNAGWTFANALNQQLLMRASNETNYGIFLGVIKYNNKNYWAFCPEGDTYLRLGMPNYRWNQIYSSSATISTSDRNEKKDIQELDESARNLIMELKPVSFKYINGETGRTHYGMIAQDVEEELEELGMTPMDFAGFCKDQKTIPCKNNEDSFTSVPVEGEYVYGLRYEEFIAPMIKTIQMQQAEIDFLKKEVAELKALIRGNIS